jgi:Leucine-rich repeat (LRR) protein
VITSHYEIGLDLSHNSLSGEIPKRLGYLPNLWYVNLGSNNLEGGIFNIKKERSALNFIDLSDNKLSGIVSSEICKATTLKYLYTFSNDLNCFAPCVSDMSLNGLKLGCGMCESSQLPTQKPTTQSDDPLCDFFQSTSLKVTNPLNGWNCDGRKALSNVCSWQGITCDLSIVSDYFPVYSIQLNNLGISGSIPDSLGKIATLTSLELNGNHLTGILPASIGDLTSLKYVDVSGNDLEGPIPGDICTLSSLENFITTGNDFDCYNKTCMESGSPKPGFEIDVEVICCHPYDCACRGKQPYFGVLSKRLLKLSLIKLSLHNFRVGERKRQR